MQIYKITNLINKKIYIGQESKDNLNYFGSGKIIILAIKKYGKENFKKEIIQKNFDSKEQMNFAEKFWIKYYNSIVPYGYNIAFGGQGGNLGIEVNRKISESQIKRYKNPNAREITRKALLGKPKTDQHRANLSKVKKGKCLTEKQLLSHTTWGLGDSNIAKRNEIRKKISEKLKINNGMKGKSTYICWLKKYGKEIADEKMKIYRKKLSDNSNQKTSKKVKCIFSNDVEKIFTSISEASRILKIKRAHIRNCCNKNVKYKDFNFLFI